jgi:hypothetical protein
MTDENLQKAIEFAAGKLDDKATNGYLRAVMETHLTDLLFQQRKRAAEKAD